MPSATEPGTGIRNRTKITILQGTAVLLKDKPPEASTRIPSSSLLTHFSYAVLGAGPSSHHEGLPTLMQSHHYGSKPKQPHLLTLKWPSPNLLDPLSTPVIRSPLFTLHTTLVLGMVTLSTCFVSVARPRSLSTSVYLSGG